jgi:Zn-dependent M28 family amino/carboxypeptidase
LGPRYPGSPGHAQAREYILAELAQAGWTASVQTARLDGVWIENILAWRGQAAAQILLGAHYDTRRYADEDTGSRRLEAVPGANDGASGVAILLELARVLPVQDTAVGLVFFDAEDGGGIEGAGWALGSTAFVAGLDQPPELAVIVDMLGDRDLQVYLEGNSDPQQAAAIWAQAQALGNAQFIPERKYSMLDDHTPFLQAGIPAVLLIDFDYPAWHTTGDTLDRVSADSLQAVGETLLAWLLAR